MSSNNLLSNQRHGNHEWDRPQQWHHKIEHPYHNNRTPNNRNQLHIEHRVDSCQLERKVSLFSSEHFFSLHLPTPPANVINKNVTAIILIMIVSCMYRIRLLNENASYCYKDARRFNLPERPYRSLIYKQIFVH